MSAGERLAGELELKETMGSALRLLPEDLRTAAIASGLLEHAEEIRLRIGREAGILALGRERGFMPGRRVTARDMDRVLEAATQASAYSAMDKLRRGFITVQGGVRVGVCGTAVTENGRMTALKEISSAAIRLPREVKGCASGIKTALGGAGWRSAVLISPPGGGKTTLLRELVRLCSEDGYRVGLADERGEIAGAWNGEPQFDVGDHTDVLTGGNKAETAMLLLRSMNPQVLAMDEITAPEDITACETAANCGVHILATVHGGSISDLRTRPLHRSLLERGVFQYAVMIKGTRGKRGYEVLEL